MYWFPFTNGEGILNEVAVAHIMKRIYTRQLITLRRVNKFWANNIPSIVNFLPVNLGTYVPPQILTTYTLL